jgi:hypothetical protein
MKMSEPVQIVMRFAQILWRKALIQIKRWVVSSTGFELVIATIK